MGSLRYRRWELEEQPEDLERRRRRLEGMLRAQPHHELPFQPYNSPSLAQPDQPAACNARSKIRSLGRAAG